MSALSPVDLRCEHLFQPQGLNTRQPRLTWGLEGSGRNRSQSAYHIVAGTDRAAVAAGAGDWWDTGKVASDGTLLITWAGRRLISDLEIWWTVQVWDETGKAGAFAGPAMFRTGLMEQADWEAKWISRQLVPPGGRFPPQDTIYDNPYWARPADHYRREFDVARKVRRATVYATALGLYELYVNGERLGDQVLAPGWTDFHTRVEYQSYDATAQVAAGRNTIAAIVGEGWYSGRVSYDSKRHGSHYGVRPALLAQLHLEYDDGSVEIVATDSSWKCGNEAIVYSDLLLGEKYDARLELPGWSRNGFEAKGWWDAEEIEVLPRAPRLDATRGVPIRKTVMFEPKFLHRTADGKLIYDVGQNLAGHCRIELDAPRDAVFVLRHGEALEPDGTLYTANLRWALATETYISKGGKQVYEPRFTFHGFQFVEVTVPEGMGPDDIRLTAIAVHSDMPSAGKFASGNEMLNRLQSNIEWTQRSNFLAVPTDCPQRDERMGWLGDAQVFFNTGVFNFDCSGFMTKWLVDVADAQTPEGIFTDVAPSIVYTRFAPRPPRGAPGWGDAGVLIPWRMYQRYGDADLLQAHYAGMVRWIDFIEAQNPSGVREYGNFSNWGDWLCLGTFTPKAVVATAYWAYQAKVMQKAAAVLGRRQDEARFAAMFRDVRAAFRKAFVDKDAKVSGDTQTAYLFALDFDLLEANERPKAVKHLKAAIVAAGGHIQTGIHGISHICPSLVENGEAESAYDLLLKETYPSWGFSIRNGATTIWERWDGWTPERGFQSVNMNSLNHYALGAIGEFMYERVAGIGIPGAGGAYRTVSLRPLPDARLGWCEASYRGHLGTVSSRWKVEGAAAQWDVSVPPGSGGAVELPAAFASVSLDGRPLADHGIEARRTADGGIAFEIGSGDWAFRLSAS